MLLLENRDSPQGAVSVAGKICDALDQPFDLHGRQARIVPSVGIALFPQHGDDEKELLRRADEAMYLAKRSGGNRFVMWAPRVGAASRAS